MAVYRNKYWLAVLSLAAMLLVSVLNYSSASASVNLFFTKKPANISSELTPTITFISTYSMVPFGTAPTECRLDGGAYSSCTSPFVTPTLAPGMYTLDVHAVGESGYGSTISSSWTVTQLPNFAGDTSTGTVVNTKVFVGYLQVQQDSTDPITVKLSVPNGVLAMSHTTGLSFTGPQTGNNIEFTGTKAEINSALATLSYTPSSSGVKPITASLFGANGSANETFNGHYYQFFVPGGGVNWATAKAVADASTFGGETGYLANITSAEENTYLLSRIADTSWLGSSDAATEGIWKWTGGPEAGLSFWSGDVGGSAVGGAFTNWQAGQPDNNAGNENCGELRQNNDTNWNDENCGSSRGYIIEYGNGANLPALNSAEITVLAINEGDSDGDGILNSKEVVSPNKGDANDDGQPDYLQPNVGSQPSPIDGNYVVVESSCDANEGTDITSESTSQKDVGFDYPHGLVNFVANDCGQPGAVVDINLYFFGDINVGDFVVRKQNANGGYSALSSAQQSQVTIGGKKALKVSYSIVDGGPLDQDGAANGNITDPVGLAKAVIIAPSTGIEKISYSPSFFAHLLKKN